LRLSSFGGYGLALAALALVVFGAIECPPLGKHIWGDKTSKDVLEYHPRISIYLEEEDEEGYQLDDWRANT